MMIVMRQYLLLSMLGFGAGIFSAQAQRSHPNVIVILSDDQGWGDLGFTGNQFVQTPHIDRIAREGAIFDNFYVCPVSSPTRAEFLTGRYSTRTGVNSTSGGGERFNLGEKTIADYFHEAGYSTALFGKWHSGTQYPYHPNARGFEEFYGFCSGHWGNYWNPVLEHNGEIVSGDGFIIDDLTNKAIDYLNAAGDKPFFLFMSYNTPHSPMQVPDSWWNRVKDRPLTQSATEAQREDSTFTKAALAFAENIDWNVGRLLSHLSKLGIEEETIVLYFADNGPNSHRWNGGMRGRKGSTDEGGVRSPLCMRWPGHISAGTHKQQLMGAIDLLPTLLGLSGIAYQEQKPLDGINMQSVLLSGNESEIDRVLYSYWQDKLSVRSAGYLLSADDHLYDLREDRVQNNPIEATQSKIYVYLKEQKNSYEREVLIDHPHKDMRPFAIGHIDEVYSKLPARDAKISGGIERSNKYPNSSYFTNWRDSNAEIRWNIDVLDDGLFEAYIYYTCDERNIGSTFTLETDRGGQEKLNFQLTTAHDMPMLGADLDRVPREESYVKGFKSLAVGKLPLAEGRATLTLKATNIAHEEAMNFWMLVLKRK